MMACVCICIILYSMYIYIYVCSLVCSIQFNTKHLMKQKTSNCMCQGTNKMACNFACQFAFVSYKESNIVVSQLISQRCTYGRLGFSLSPETLPKVGNTLLRLFTWGEIGEWWSWGLLCSNLDHHEEAFKAWMLSSSHVLNLYYQSISPNYCGVSSSQ